MKAAKQTQPSGDHQDAHVQSGLRKAEQLLQQRGAAVVSVTDNAVVSAKLVPPPRSGRELDRPRLDAVLDQFGNSHGDRDGPTVAVVSAPPGFGKTTLVASFARRVAARGQLKMAWATLDSTDADPSRLAAVVQTAAAHAGIPTPPGESRPPSLHLGRLCETIGAQPDPVLIVLDDVHEITNRAALADLDLLVRWMPTNLRLVLVARYDLPLPELTRRQVAGSLIEIRAADMSFTTDEVREAVDPALAPRADTLWHQTQGWPAGVRLAELAMLHDPTRTAPDHPLDGGAVGYLFGESFVRQPRDVQDLLLAVAEVDPVSIDLAVTLTGRPDAGAMLRTVVTWGSLVTQIWDGDAGQVLFRIHPLLRSYLAAEAVLRNPGAASRRRATAAAWYVEHRQPLTAVTHALASGDGAAVDDTLAEVGWPLLLDGQGDQLRRLLTGNCPPSAWAVVIRAVMSLCAGRPDEARRLLEQARELPGSLDRRLTAATQLISAHLARLERAAAVPVLHPVGPAVIDLALLLDTVRATEVIGQGQLADAATALRESIAIAQTSGHPTLRRSMAAGLAVIELMRGALPQMRLAAAWAAEPGPGYETDLATALIALADHRALVPAPAPATAAAATPACAALANLVSVLTQVLALTVDHSAGTDPGATAFLQQWLIGPGETGAVDDLSVRAFASTAARLALAAHRRDVLVAVRERTGALPGPSDAAVTLLEAWERVADGAPRRALSLLHQTGVTAEPDPSSLTVHQETQLLIARCAFSLDRPADGRAALQTALHLARRSGDLRLFLEYGTVITDELAEHRERYAASHDLVGRILTARATADLVEPVLLTPREQELLGELASLDTLDDIAAGLHVSVNTVKTHLKGIYRKLEASSRREAVQEARAIGLL